MASSPSSTSTTTSPSTLQHRTWVHFLGGGIGGTIGAVMTCPLEVVKTRLQSSLYTSQHNLGIFPMLRSICVNEGWTALWKGLGPNLVGVIPARAVHFSVYASTKHYLSQEFSEKPGDPAAWWMNSMAAASAGVATATVTNPIWLIKTRLQLQQRDPPVSIPSSSSVKSTPGACTTKPASASWNRITVAGVSSLSDGKHLPLTDAASVPRYKNAWDCFNQVVRQEGWRGLYRGLGASYFGIAEGTLQWLLYEQLKHGVHDYRGRSTSAKDIATAWPWMDYLMTAGLSKLMASALTYPHEVLRTRLRQVITVPDGSNPAVTVTRPRYAGMMDVWRTVMREEGGLAFYGGMKAHLLRTVPNTAIMFACYGLFVFIL